MSSNCKTNKSDRRKRAGGWGKGGGGGRSQRGSNCKTNKSSVGALSFELQTKASRSVGMVWGGGPTGGQRGSNCKTNKTVGALSFKQKASRSWMGMGWGGEVRRWQAVHTDEFKL